MANALGIDLGEVYRTVEAVKTSRAARGASEAATGRTNAIAQAAAGANPAQPETMAALIALDPKMAGDITAAYTGMDEAARATAKTQAETLGQLAYGVQSAADPVAAYAAVLEGLKPEERAGLPESYDPNWVTLQLARAREIDGIYDRIDAEAADARGQSNALQLETVKSGNSEAAAVADDERGQTNALALEGVKADNSIREKVAVEEAKGAGGVDTAGSNAIAKSTAALFGGTFGPDGSFGGMDEAQSRKALEVAAEAERLIKDTPGLAINDAVLQASEKLGYQIAGINQKANNVVANGGNAAADGPKSDPFNLGF